MTEKKRTGYTDREGVEGTLGKSGKRITRTAGRRSWRKWRVSGPVGEVRVRKMEDEEGTMKGTRIEIELNEAEVNALREVRRRLGEELNGFERDLLDRITAKIDDEEEGGTPRYGLAGR